MANKVAFLRASHFFSIISGYKYRLPVSFGGRPRCLSSNPSGNVSGTWYNELGSEMTLALNVDGILSGTYSNNAPDSAPVKEKLVGSVGSDGSPATLGFTVNFEDGKYTTSWSGQYFNKDDNEVLLTTWIMTANVPEINEYWEATNVGQDRFTRQPQAQTKGRKSLVSQHLAKMAKK